MRFFFYLHFLSVVFASKPQSSLLNASLSLQDAFASLLPTDTLPKPSDPTPRLIMYVQTFTDTAGHPLSLLPLLEHSTKVTHIILGSVHLHEEPGVIMLNNEPFDSEIYDAIWTEVKILQQNGVKVMALLGGAAPGTYGRLSGSDEKFRAYYIPLLHLLKRHRLDGLDIDIEEPVPLSTPLRLLRNLYADQGPDFLLTMAPMANAMSEDDTSLSGFSYRALDDLAVDNQELRDGGKGEGQISTKLVSWYNVQFYAGYARSPTMYNSIAEAGYEVERIVMGVTTSKEGYENGFTSLKTLGKTIRSLSEGYGDRFGGVAGWEYWDAGRDEGDMGMRTGGEPWRWVERIGRSVFGGKTTRKRPREKENRGLGGECWRRCLRGDS